MEISMKSIVDLSGTIKNGMWGYRVLPGLETIIPEVEVETIATVEKNGFFSSKLTLSTVSGTYLEAGSHILPDGKCLDEYPPERFIKPVKIVKLPRQAPKALIDVTLIERHASDIETDDALIIDTGWGRMWNRPGYVLSCPNFCRDALEWVLAQDISIFGVDVPCIEASWSEEDDEQKGLLLAELFRRDVLLLAPLVNLERVQGKSGKLICLPLSVKGTSGAPARVLFIEE
jgi:arylformamidase